MDREDWRVWWIRTLSLGLDIEVKNGAENSVLKRIHSGCNLG